MSEPYIPLEFVEEQGFFVPSQREIAKRISEFYGFRYEAIEIEKITYHTAISSLGYSFKLPSNVVFRVRGFAYSTFFDRTFSRAYLWDTDSQQTQSLKVGE